jgi:KDO2-lipid IV(A) lauroyltransferase
MPGNRDDRAYFLYRFGARALRCLPRVFARRLMGRLGLVIYHLSKSTRQVVSDNLRVVVGPALSEEELQTIVAASFASYASYWSDIFHIASLTNANIDQFFSELDLEPLKRTLDSGGALLVVPHLGTWEIGGLWVHLHGYVVHSVAEPASSERLTNWFTKERARLGLDVHTLGDKTMAILLEALSRGEVVALVADRDIVGDGIEVTLFGQKTRMPGGPALLALRSGKPLIPCAIYFDRHDMHFPVVLDAIAVARQGTLREDVARITQDLAFAFEKLIGRAPEQWHVFQPFWLPPTKQRQD